jgi:hypothetical protein
MLTHAVIATVNKRGKIKASSVAHDGYPQYMMPILNKLKTKRAVDAIIDTMGTDGDSSIVYDSKTKNVDVAVRCGSKSHRKSKTTFNDFGELWSGFGLHIDYFYIFGRNEPKWEWVSWFDFEEKFIQ